MGDIRLETHGKVLVVTLDRPPVNAMNRAMREEIVLGRGEPRGGGGGRGGVGLHANPVRGVAVGKNVL